MAADKTAKGDDPWVSGGDPWLVQTKRGAKPVASTGVLGNLEANPPRTRWSRSREINKAKNEIEELKSMRVAMRTEMERARRQYNVALEAFDRERERARTARRNVGHGVTQEYLRTYKVYENLEAQVCQIEHKLDSLGVDIALCRTATWQTEESPSRDFPRQPGPV